MKKIIGVALVFCIACGGGKGGGGAGASGVDPTKTLPELSTGEVMDLCEYFTELAGPERTIDCGDGQTVTVGTNDPAGDIAECVSEFEADRDQFPNCPATVGEVEQCLEDLHSFSDAELCGDTGLPPSCAPLFNDPDCSNI